jgi:Tol biopolymer transport system component
MNRRAFLGSLAVLAGASGCQHTGTRSSARRGRLFFTSAGKTCVINSDGTGLRALEFDVPNQATWQPSAFFPDGRRVLFLSMEPRRDGPGRPFDAYYTQTPTHIWVHDLANGSLTEVANQERMAVFYTPALLLGEERLLVQVVRNRVGQIFNMNLDGTDAREFTRAGEGLPYGFDLSPDRKRVAFHLASPQGYQIWTSDLEGRDRRLVAGHGDHLFFGPTWSSDGQWLAFLDCHYKTDPAHDWADIRVARPDGTEMRTVTKDQEHWFGATYGNPQHRGGGSNMLAWMRDGNILFSRRLPDSKTPWEFQPQRPDVDHFNRDWKPELARGGTELCVLNPRDASMTALTHESPSIWDCRGVPSPEGQSIAFCRCPVGETPSLWMMRSDGTEARLLTRGLDNRGADHPRWIPTV